MAEQALVRSLQKELNKASSVQVKKWCEAYMKGVLVFRGVKSPEVRQIVKTWHHKKALYALPKEDQLQLASLLIRSLYAEDKFAGIFYLQHFLIDEFSFDDLMMEFEQLFEDGCFYDWSTTDWFIVRVLMPLMKRHGAPARKRIVAWHKASNLWQRRASMVTLRAIVAEPKLTDLIDRQIRKILPTKERFLQTAVGWVLADLAKHDPVLAEALVRKHLQNLSMEVVRRHTKGLAAHKDFMALRRELRS
jgi:3-methyladenine DNA glycosylase AlkD